MKIGYLFSRYPVPSQTFCETEMRALEDGGCEIEIYSCSPPRTSFRHDAAGRPRGPVFYAPPQLGLELERLAAVERNEWPAALIAEHEARFGPQYKPARRALHATAFASRLQRRGIEHIHVHFANRATHAALFIQALTGLPFSFTAHGQDFLVDLGSDALLQEMCRRAAFVVTVSDFSRQALLERCPEADGKVHRVYNGLPLDRCPAPHPVAHEDAQGPLRIFSAGRLIDFKGFDVLIAACAVLRERGVPVECEIAGEGPAEPALRAQITCLDLTANVRLAGLLPQAQIRARLAHCDVFALGSRVDAKGACDVLPTVILEAMEAGRPVVSTRLAGIPEMVVDGETGILVEPGDAIALADGLTTLAHDPLLRGRFGQAGRERLSNFFSAEASARQLATLFLASSPNSEKGGGRAQHGIREGAALAVLLDTWPEPDDAAPPLATLLDGIPGVSVWALGVGSTSSPPLPGGKMLSLAGRIEFLPDAMVLEAEWRERAAEAHGIEAWRGDLGASLETSDFLLAARRALYLHHNWLRGSSARHIHAVGPAALLCAWLLLRLEPARQASFLLPSGSKNAARNSLPKSVLRRVAPAFVGGWLPGAPRLAAELGPGFDGRDLPAQAEGWQVWQNTLDGWAATAQRRPEPSPPTYE